MVNGPDIQVLPEVRRVEGETGLKVRTLISPGGGHHLRLPEWRDALPEATVWVPPVRIPHTPSAQKLMQGPRVKVMDLANPMPELAGTVDFVIFDGLLGFPDMRTTFEGGKEGFFTMFKIMKEMMTLHTPVDEVWLRHAATDTVVAGENLGWFLSEKTHASFPFMMRKMMKAKTVFVQDKARKVADKEKVAAAWREVLAWPCRTLMGYHETPGDAFVGDGQAALRQAVIAAGQLPEAAAKAS
jgi:hypothetical protein